jgi:hypothetical protein
MSETQKLAAILVADIFGYSRLAGADEDRILAPLRTLRSDVIQWPLSPLFLLAASAAPLPVIYRPRKSAIRRERL